jgi:hypothetical protein
MVTGRMGEVGKVFQVSGIGQFIDIDDRDLRIVLQIIPNEIASNKSTTACHE